MESRKSDFNEGAYRRSVTIKIQNFKSIDDGWLHDIIQSVLFSLLKVLGICDLVATVNSLLQMLVRMNP